MAKGKLDWVVSWTLGSLIIKEKWENEILLIKYLYGDRVMDMRTPFFLESTAAKNALP